MLLDPNLAVRPVATGVRLPSGMAFLGPEDLLVLDLHNGAVRRVANGVLQTDPVLNLPVNTSTNERGLLGITLDPDFAHDHYVYLFWTESNTGQVSSDPLALDLLGNRVDRYVWNGSILTFERNLLRLRSYQNDAGQGATGDSNGGKLRFGPDGKLYIYVGDGDRRGWLQNISIGHGPFGKDDQFGGPEPDDAHLTGVILRLNPDGSIPDNNPFADIRTSLEAPVLSGSGGAGTGSFAAFLNQAMDTFTAHVTFVQGLPSNVLAGQVRLGDADGPVIFNVPNFPQGITSGELTTTLTAANFVAEPSQGINTLSDAVHAVLNGRTNFTIYTTRGEISGPIGQLDPAITANLHKIFAYGFRNSFGMAFDPYSGRLWEAENAESSFDHLNYIEPGQNGGWIQIMGPAERVPEYKHIETHGIDCDNGHPFSDDWQVRYKPDLLADTPEGALSHLFMLPGAHFRNPEFSWRYDVAPAAVGFVTGSALGPEYDGNLFVGNGQDVDKALHQGYLMRFQFNADRTAFTLPDDPHIVGKGAENNCKNDGTGSEGLVIGMNFGIVTDIQTGPNGNLYVSSFFPDRTIYEIYRPNGATQAVALAYRAGVLALGGGGMAGQGVVGALAEPSGTAGPCGEAISPLRYEATAAAVSGLATVTSDRPALPAHKPRALTREAAAADQVFGSVTVEDQGLAACGWDEGRLDLVRPGGV